MGICSCCRVTYLMYAVAYVSLLFSATYALTGNETDRLALLEFKAKITGDPLGILETWNETKHFCNWYGVTCGRNQSRVTALNLSSLQLVGSISPHIGNFSFLETLRLENNSLIHQIPPEIGYLRRLQILYLHNNSLTGEIPSNLSSCSELIGLSLGNQDIVGEIPKEFGSLSKLQLLSVSRSNLTGRIPSSLGNMSSLTALSLSLNNFIGSIPDTLGQLKHLTYVALGGNHLSGYVPPSLFNLSSIMILDIGTNRLQGHLPSDMFITLPNLNDLEVGHNNFTGSIPASLSNASALGRIIATGNNFIGDVPQLSKLNALYWFIISENSLGTRGPGDLNFLCSMTNATDLEIVDIGRNNFGGSLPECVGNLSSKLTDLIVQENHISGKVPAGIQNLVSLTTLAVSNNKLSGTIPQALGNLKNMVIMLFDQNYFSGSIPATLGNFSNLNILLLAANSLQGSIPSSLGLCKNLQGLDLSDNNLSGSVPSEVVSLSSLSQFLNFSNNQLTGRLPREIGHLRNLGMLDISNNMLSGAIPSNLGSCVVLEQLLMNGNNFQGPIPSTFSSLRGLQELDLSDNNLSGEIPKLLTTFKSLEYLNLSYNDFSGTVPTEGVFMNVTAISLAGNSRLCGGIPEIHLPRCIVKKSNIRRSSSRLKVSIAVISGLLVAALLVFLLFLLRSKRKTQASPTSSMVNHLLQVSYQDLHKATNGFASQNLIGAGSFSSVYKGILDEGTLIAVKVLDLQHHGAAKSFMAECEALKNIKHRNLVKVVTACSSIDYQGNDFKALVYEFMPKGSLEDWLHPSTKLEDATQDQPRKLSLLERLNIALDVSSALEYLHYQCETPIVHCDLKPSNILLDDEFTAHLSDFGIAKILRSDSKNTATVDKSSSRFFRGTMGYAPPEYGIGSEVSMQGDSYSYGILLLEMFTGKRPTNEMFKDDWSINKYAMCALPDKVTEIVDPSLFEGDSWIGKEIIECLESIIGVAVACSIESPVERLNIHDVAKKLSSIKEKLVGTTM